MAKKGVARRTRLTVHDGFGAFRGPAPGNTSETSPPLAGWKVRRLQSVDAPVSPEALLTELAAAVIEPAVVGRPGACPAHPPSRMQVAPSPLKLSARPL